MVSLDHQTDEQLIMAVCCSDFDFADFHFTTCHTFILTNELVHMAWAVMTCAGTVPSMTPAYQSHFALGSSSQTSNPVLSASSLYPGSS